MEVVVITLWSIIALGFVVMVLRYLYAERQDTEVRR